MFPSLLDKNHHHRKSTTVSKYAEGDWSFADVASSVSLVCCSSPLGRRTAVRHTLPRAAWTG